MFRVNNPPSELELHIASAHTWTFMEQAYAMRHPDRYLAHLAIVDEVHWADSHGAIMVTDAPVTEKASWWGEGFRQIARVVDISSARRQDRVADYGRFVKANLWPQEYDWWQDGRGDQLGIDDILPPAAVVEGLFRSWYDNRSGRSRAVEGYIGSVGGTPQKSQAEMYVPRQQQSGDIYWLEYVQGLLRQ